MKRPPQGAEKKQGLPLFLSFFLFAESLSFWFRVHLLSLSAQAGTETPQTRFSKERQMRVFAGGKRRRAMRHFSDGCHCGPALAISLPSSFFIIHTVIYFNKWRGACSSPARSHWHQCRINRELFAIAELSWQTFSVSFPRKHLKQITNLMLHLPNKRREREEKKNWHINTCSTAQWHQQINEVIHTMSSLIRVVWQAVTPGIMLTVISGRPSTRKPGRSGFLFLFFHRMSF